MRIFLTSGQCCHPTHINYSWPKWKNRLLLYSKPMSPVVSCRHVITAKITSASWPRPCSCRASHDTYFPSSAFIANICLYFDKLTFINLSILISLWILLFYYLTHPFCVILRPFWRHFDENLVQLSAMNWLHWKPSINPSNIMTKYQLLNQ